MRYNRDMNILLTGGSGYIGSHTAVELCDAGHSVVVIDNLSNSSRESLTRVAEITGKEIPFYEGDVRDGTLLDQIFTEHTIDGAVHFAGLKAVGESVDKPLEYYSNNLDSTIVLLEKMREHRIKKFVFSSSATVYGIPDELPITEDSRVGVGITNPYGWTKFMNEQIIKDFAATIDGFEATILRYFNPVGAHSSGLIGEDPNDTPNNLFPYISQTAAGRRAEVGVFGDDYDTPDGTGVRDYIHVVDLARGHLAALERSASGVSIYNLGTGKGTSVLEAIAAFSEACGHEIPYKILPRRAGDIAACYASADRAARDLGWRAQLTINDACRDAWRWQSQNPDGYQRNNAVSV